MRKSGAPKRLIFFVIFALDPARIEGTPTEGARIDGPFNFSFDLLFGSGDMSNVGAHACARYFDSLRVQRHLHRWDI